MKAPTDGSYWVAPRLLAGKYPGALVEAAARSKVQALLDAGVRAFIDLTEVGELRPYAHLLPSDVAHHRIAVRDVTCPAEGQVRRAIDVIESAGRTGVAYVHCRGGCGRTGVVLGCYFVGQGLAADKALARVHELTRTLWDKPCPETPEQIDFVRRWKV